MNAANFRAVWQDFKNRGSAWATEQIADFFWNQALAHEREQREEEEASVCPEDFGFVEYIKLLEGQVMQAESRLRDPQTTDTCQAVPPHQMAYLREEEGYESGGTQGWVVTRAAGCAACEAVAKAREGVK